MLAGAGLRILGYQSVTRYYDSIRNLNRDLTLLRHPRVITGLLVDRGIDPLGGVAELDLWSGLSYVLLVHSHTTS